MTLKTNRKTVNGGLWKRWLGRFGGSVACAYVCTLGLFSLASGHAGGLDATLVQSLAIAVLPLVIVGLCALPGRRSGPSVFVALAVPFLHLS
ncbi:hypothetical protein HLH36_14470 [Gluconacetobacter aggeris]|uniref:Uncharacterized protein n=1 Tax=Gluconacetobacter aggeris TaxID=1286186 RepID=A0A7W4NX48_9PROT|nr:hypothetical protein [Gluconacetobacter aggeris]MBB2169541.1 hypothetical protein [Gluconacetobacter aggeris]